MASVHLTKNPDVQELHKDSDDLQQAKSIVAKAAVGVISYPLTFSKTLFQLGFEPYPMSTGKVFFVAGRDAYFLPNVFKYIAHVYKDYGICALYRGVEAGLVGTLAGGFAAYYAEKYLDIHYPDVGGRPENLDRKDDELTNYESFRVHVRSAIRRSISTTIGITITHPFAVMMVREIAQHIGGEWKYPNVVLGLLRVGHEEGLPGLFSGLVPSLVANYIRILGIAGLGYVANRALLKAEKESHDDDAKESIHNLRKYAPLLIPFAVNGLSYPFEVCTTVFAVVGSQLAISMLPYAPSFNHWTEAYDYLKPEGLTRGSRLLMREHKGAVTVGTDHGLYVSNKYFI